MITNQSFSIISQLLLSGVVIDEVCYRHHHHALQDEQFLLEVNDFLQKIERRCVSTQDGSGFYCVYTNAQADGVQSKVRQQFHHWTKTIEPLSLWLRLCHNTNNQQALLQTGDIIHYHELSKYVTQSERARTQLVQIVRLIGSNSQEVKNQLTSVLEFLQKEQYLLALDNDKLTFRATAKWALFYEQLDYIASCEALVEPEEDTQGQLL